MALGVSRTSCRSFYVFCGVIYVLSWNAFWVEPHILWQLIYFEFEFNFLECFLLTFLFHIVSFPFFHFHFSIYSEIFFFVYFLLIFLIFIQRFFNRVSRQLGHPVGGSATRLTRNNSQEKTSPRCLFFGIPIAPITSLHVGIPAHRNLEAVPKQQGRIAPISVPSPS